MQSLRLLPLSLAIALTISAAPSVTFGAPTAADLDEAKKHFAQGVKLFEENDYKGALVEFRHAHQLAPNWQVLFNIGQCHYQLLDYPAALAALEEYLEKGGESVPPERRAAVGKDVEELRKRVAKVTVEVDVDGADVLVDDVVVGKSPLGKPIVVATGARRVTARKAGRAESSKLVEVAGGDTVTVALRLPEVAGPAKELGRPTSTLTWVGFSLAGVGLATGTVFGLLALRQRSDVGTICEGSGSQRVCPSSADAEVEALSRDAWISNVGFGVGVIGLGLGIYGLLSAPTAGETKTVSAT